MAGVIVHQYRVDSFFGDPPQLHSLTHMGVERTPERSIGWTDSHQMPSLHAHCRHVLSGPAIVIIALCISSALQIPGRRSDSRGLQ